MPLLSHGVFPKQGERALLFLTFFFTWEFGVIHFGINKEEEGLEVAGVFIWLSLHRDP